jgi:hypothetical protein
MKAHLRLRIQSLENRCFGCLGDMHSPLIYNGMGGIWLLGRDREGWFWISVMYIPVETCSVFFLIEIQWARIFNCYESQYGMD